MLELDGEDLRRQHCALMSPRRSFAKFAATAGRSRSRSERHRLLPLRPHDAGSLQRRVWGDESNNEHPAKIEVNRKSRIEHSAAGESAIFRKWAIIETGGS
jgi:hypothetical protein